MDNIERKRFIIFLIIALIFVGITGYYHFQNNPLQFSASTVISQIRNIKLPFTDIKNLSAPNIIPIEPGRINNNDCGLSFVIPSEWKVNKTVNGNRFCEYDIDAPDKRTGWLIVGVPGFLPSNKTAYEQFTWEDVMNEINSNKEGMQIENITIAGAQGIRVLVTSRDGWSPNVMYFFRKGNSVFFVRYTVGSERTDNYYNDIQPVLNSIRFTQNDSFYNKPMTVGPR